MAKKNNQEVGANQKRINELADFLYHSDNPDDVPLRIAVDTGRFTGNSLSKKDFLDLMEILLNSKNLKKDLSKFRKGLSNNEFANGWIKFWREDIIKSDLRLLEIFFKRSKKNQVIIRSKK